ncbi:hypothetical protein OZX73_00725 [Bifidobacterium sp. ESL0775]|uniref:hypothetical protein n=1 Tax=Bifidobacterium sp. ESL0775 TaxID=2983230 RepID=UPI0023FA28BF|nr:hypothetical protein [Bifidobacterium sp. ESL0775]WEV69455.1 hypothetical protein OZX73_00725 [Bifidobacterium sp. ESL0775]
MGNTNFSNGVDLSKQPKEVQNWLEFIRRDQEEIRKNMQQDREYFSRQAGFKN